MDVDKAIEFLLSESARLDAMQAQLTGQLRTAVRLGVAMSRRAFNAIDALAGQQRETEKGFAARGQDLDRRIAELAEQQRETAATLQAFIQNTERRWGGNGHGPRTGA